MSRGRTGYGWAMAADTRDWTVPAPVRALLWWPPVALVLGVVAPDAAAGAIAVVGGVLAVIGALGPVLARALELLGVDAPVVARIGRSPLLGGAAEVGEIRATF